MKTFFTVVIPLYNKRNYIKNTIQSVLNQTFKDFEILIVNDGSTDGSEEVVKTFKNSRIRLISQENKGVSEARNKGISEAKGEYIALLDADDYWYPHHLNSLKQLIELFPEAGLYGDRYEIILQNKTARLSSLSEYIQIEPVLIKDYFAESLADPILWTSATAFKKDMFYEIGEFDSNLRTAQDLDFFLRAALKFPVAFHPKVGMRYFKDSENNLAKSKFNTDRVYFVTKFKEEEKENPSLKHYLDVNRYAIALRCKLDGSPLWKKLVPEIDHKHLNQKQKLLLKLPTSLLRIFKNTHSFLISKGIYLTAFR